MEKRRKVVLAGGSGFLGNLLSHWFTTKGFEVVVLSRKHFNSQTARVVLWDGKSQDSWCDELDDALALINLAGKSVDCRYHAYNRKILTDSRILSTRVLGQAVAACSNPPEVWLNSSTATIYEHTYGPAHSEDGRIAASPDAKDEFSIELATSWEEEFGKQTCPKTRHVLLRMAMVFDQSGSVYKVLRRLTSLGLGGKMGHGKQYVSWIHSVDFCRAIEWLVFNETSDGIYNLASPNPLTNNQMMTLMRKVIGVPFGLPASKLMLELGAFFLRTETELIIKSRRVVPTRLLSEGFEFEFPSFEMSLNKLKSDV